MKVLAFAAVLLLSAPAALSSQELKDAFDGLSQAATGKDVPLILKSANEVFALAKTTLETAAPEGADEKAAWQVRVDYAKSIQTQAEYALVTFALQAPAADQIQVFAALEAASPKSQYLDGIYSQYFLALNQTGASNRIVPIAEKALANLPENEDLLLLLTDDALNRKQLDKALSLANRLSAVMVRHPKPPGLSAADWDKKKATCLSHAYWTAGVVSGEKQQWVNADKNLRAALPLIQGNNAMLAPAYYYLGVANYSLGRMTNSKAKILEGASFSEKSAAIQGTLQQQAWRNAQAMKTEAGKMR